METKVVKLEIGKLFAVVITVVVIALVAGSLLQSDFFAGNVTEGKTNLTKYELIKLDTCDFTEDEIKWWMDRSDLLDSEYNVFKKCVENLSEEDANAINTELIENRIDDDDAYSINTGVIENDIDDDDANTINTGVIENDIDDDDANTINTGVIENDIDDDDANTINNANTIDTENRIDDDDANTINTELIENKTGEEEQAYTTDPEEKDDKYVDPERR